MSEPLTTKRCDLCKWHERFSGRWRTNNACFRPETRGLHDGQPQWTPYARDLLSAQPDAGATKSVVMRQNGGVWCGVDGTLFEPYVSPAKETLRGFRVGLTFWRRREPVK